MAARCQLRPARENLEIEKVVEALDHLASVFEAAVGLHLSSARGRGITVSGLGQHTAAEAAAMCAPPRALPHLFVASLLFLTLALELFLLRPRTFRLAGAPALGLLAFGSVCGSNGNCARLSWLPRRDSCRAPVASRHVTGVPLATLLLGLLVGLGLGLLLLLLARLLRLLLLDEALAVRVLALGALKALKLGVQGRGLRVAALVRADLEVVVVVVEPASARGKRGTIPRGQKHAKSEDHTGTEQRSTKTTYDPSRLVFIFVSAASSSTISASIRSRASDTLRSGMSVLGLPSGAAAAALDGVTAGAVAVFSVTVAAGGGAGAAAAVLVAAGGAAV